MAQQHILTGLFDTRPDAERAVEYLVQHLDIGRGAVRVHAAGARNVTAGTHDRRAEGHQATPAPGGAGEPDAEDLAAALRDLAIPEADRAAYAEGIRRGGILISAQVPEEKLDAAMRAFEENNAVDLEERQAGWGAAGGGGDAARDIPGGRAGGERDIAGATQRFAETGKDTAGQGPRAGEAGTGWAGTATGRALGLAPDGSRPAASGSDGPVVGGQTSGGAARTSGAGVAPAPTQPNAGSSTLRPGEAGDSATAQTLHATGAGERRGTRARAYPGAPARPEQERDPGR